MQKYKIVLELTNFNSKRSADFVDSIIIRFFAEILSYSKKDQTRALWPYNNYRESANDDAVSRFLLNSEPIILLLVKINLSILSGKRHGVTWEDRQGDSTSQTTIPDQTAIGRRKNRLRGSEALDKISCKNIKYASKRTNIKAHMPEEFAEYMNV